MPASDPARHGVAKKKDAMKADSVVGRQRVRDLREIGRGPKADEKVD